MRLFAFFLFGSHVSSSIKGENYTEYGFENVNWSWFGVSFNVQVMTCGIKRLLIISIYR